MFICSKCGAHITSVDVKLTRWMSIDLAEDNSVDEKDLARAVIELDTDPEEIHQEEAVLVCLRCGRITPLAWNAEATALVQPQA